MSLLPRIAERVIGRPLLITPEKASIIFDVLAGRIVPAALVDEGILEAVQPDLPAFLTRSVRPDGPGAYRDAAPRNQYGARLSPISVTRGVAQITIDGSLVNRGAYVGASSGLVSYEGLYTQIQEAVASTDVEGILLDINSPGGEAGGMFSLANAVRDAAQKKPVVAFINDMAASAAYGIASQASQIIVSPSSTVGSIGVVLMHMDRSGELEKRGVKPTIIHAGAHKVDGNPFGPLPDEVRASLQTEVDKIYGLFLDTVAAGRGRKLSRKAAAATEARVYTGQDAVDLGLADGIASFAEVMSSLSKGRKVSFSTPASSGAKMSTNPETPAAAAPAAPAAAPAAPAAPVATVDAGAVKARIKSITTHAEAKGREDLAQHLAFDTDLSAEAAVAILAKSPKAEAEAPKAEAAQAYVEKKVEAGALGVAPIAAAPASETEKVKAGWDKAVAAANRRFDVK